MYKRMGQAMYRYRWRIPIFPQECLWRKQWKNHIKNRPRQCLIKEGGTMTDLPRQSEEGKERDRKSKRQRDGDPRALTLCHPHKVEETHEGDSTRSGRMHLLRQVTLHPLWMILPRIPVKILLPLPPWKKDDGRRGAMIATNERRRPS